MRQSRFGEAVREFFRTAGYAEVDTPVLSPFLIPEPAIEVFQTEYLPPKGAARPMWLAPSPELWMKRLIAAGAGDIFQVSRCFRNCEYGGPHHNPEFRLLEWYTVGAGYMDSITVAEGLFDHLLGRVAPVPDSARLAPPFLRVTMQEAFQRYAGIDLGGCQDAGRMKAAGEERGVSMTGSPTWEQAFHIVFLTLVEPRLPRNKPLVLLDYPALVPTTARRRSGTPWAERWELFVDGVEVANCYTEETDPSALAALVREEEERRSDCRTSHAIDHGFAGLFPPGFPACSGAAMGMDRLEMAFAGEKSLEGVIFFPFSAIVNGQSGTEA
jgi:elongation factor P--(R)-beta-lysine ligase